MGKGMKNNSRGFTLTEAMISLGITGVLLGSVMAAYNFSGKAFQLENNRGELRQGLEKALEKMKEEVRLSDGGKILFNPSTASTYTALSIPFATLDANGLYTYSSGITWDRTIVYFLYTNAGKTELRRSFITSYNTDTATRQAQLDTIVSTGDIPNGGSYSGTTSTLLTADSISFTIASTNPTFDGYASSTQLSGNTSFGSVRLTSGNHTIRFQITGKNAA